MASGSKTKEYRVVDRGGGDRRLTDKLVGGMAVVIGALSAIIWGIIWTQVSSTTGRVAVLEGDKRVIEEKLNEMKNSLDRIEIRMEQVKDPPRNK